MNVMFITGSGTDIGKTYVTVLLMRQVRASGRPVRALKPVATGMVPSSDPAFAESDTARLLRAQALSTDEAAVAACTPWRFAAPLSPDMAAAAEGKTLDLGAVVGWTRSAIAQAISGTLVLVEGVGGVMSPITNDGLNIDLIEALECPAIVVGGSYLGAITHTLTAIEALRARAIPLQAVVLNETEGSPVDFAETVVSLSRFAPNARIATVLYGDTTLKGFEI